MAWSDAARRAAAEIRRRKAQIHTAQIRGRGVLKTISEDEPLTLSAGIKPYAGSDGLHSVEPRSGLKAWTTYPFTSRLESVRIIGMDGHFDQYTVWKYKWLSGPDKGLIQSHYGRSFWLPSLKGK